jgi:hypothetical protein
MAYTVEELIEELKRCNPRQPVAVSMKRGNDEVVVFYSTEPLDEVRNVSQSEANPVILRSNQ